MVPENTEFDTLCCPLLLILGTEDLRETPIWVAACGGAVIAFYIDGILALIESFMFKFEI